MVYINDIIIFRTNGLTSKELVDTNIVYTNCTFYMDITADYCLKYITNKCNNIFNAYLKKCNFVCCKGSSTIGHKISIIQSTTLCTMPVQPYWITKFPLPYRIDK